MILSTAPAPAAVPVAPGIPGSVLAGAWDLGVTVLYMGAFCCL
jgi:hypothetical protein